MNQIPEALWSISAVELLQKLKTTKDGLPGNEAFLRLTRFGANLLKSPKRSDSLTLLLAQFKSPIVFMLFIATGLSVFLRDSIKRRFFRTVWHGCCVINKQTMGLRDAKSVLIFGPGEAKGELKKLMEQNDASGKMLS